MASAQIENVQKALVTHLSLLGISLVAAPLVSSEGSRAGRVWQGFLVGLLARTVGKALEPILNSRSRSQDLSLSRRYDGGFYTAEQKFRPLR